MIDPRNPDYSLQPGCMSRSYHGDVAQDLAYTIMTPFYNTGEIFWRTARSIFNQSLQNFEWIVVEDGSTRPECLEILEAVAASDPRVRVVRHAANKGLSAARNTGYRAARTDLVLQIDSDDLLEPTAAEKWVWFLRSHPEYAWVGSYTVGFEAQEYLYTRSFDEREVFLQENLTTPTSMIRQSAFLAAGGYDEANRAGLEDWDFWLRGAANGLWGGNIAEYLQWYRRRPTHTDRWTAWSPEGIEMFRERWRSQAPHLYEPEGFPQPAAPAKALEIVAPINPLRIEAKERALFLVENLGAMDGELLAKACKIREAGGHVTFIGVSPATPEEMAEAYKITDDVFSTSNFIRADCEQAFIEYISSSRNINLKFGIKN